MEQEIEIGMIDGNKLVLTAAAEDIINAEVDSDSDATETDARVNQLIANSSITLTSDENDCQNYVIVNEEDLSPDNSSSLIIKRPDVRNFEDNNIIIDDGKVRPFKCELCGKLFTKPEVMKRHKRSHSMTKDFSCTFCDMSFHRRDCLTDHLRNHTGIDLFINLK